MHAENTRKLNWNVQSLFIISVVACFSALTLRFIAFPQAKMALTKSITLKEYDKYIAQEGGYERIKNHLQENNRLLNTKLQSILQGMGDSQGLSDFLKILITKAKEAGIEFVKMEPQNESTFNDYLRYPVLLEMRTSYRSLVTFIKSLESLPRLIRLERLAITAKNGENLEVRILAVCFLKSEK